MAIKTREEIMESIRSRFAEDTSDETLSLIEDVSDTLTDFETKAKGDGKDWKSEAERIDKEWREKYKARFFSTGNPDPEPDPEDPEDPKVLTYDELFKEGE